MITKDVIDNIYKRYKSRPESPDLLNMPLLFEHAIDNHAIYVDDGNLVIESVEPESPFHTIDLAHIHGITEFERHVAIVLANAIIFLNKHDSGVNIHLKMPKRSIIDKIRESLNREDHPDF